MGQPILLCSDRACSSVPADQGNTGLAGNCKVVMCYFQGQLPFLFFVETISLVGAAPCFGTTGRPVPRI